MERNEKDKRRENDKKSINRFIVLERWKERLIHWKDNYERGCRNRRRKEVGIASRQEYIYTRHQSLVALQFQTTIKTYARFRRLDRVEDFVREIFDLSFFFFSSISNFFFFFEFGREKNEREYEEEKRLRLEKLDGNCDDIRGALREWNRVCTACIRKV